MTISFDFFGAYLEHKPVFDEMARSMQSHGHRAGIIAGLREKEFDQTSRRVIDNMARIKDSLGFIPNFIYLWGENETIGNGSLWKCYKLDDEDVYMHFDSNALELKKYTPRWIVKTLDSGQPKKF